MEIQDFKQSIATANTQTAIKDWFNYYFNSLKVGLITSIVGSSHLKSGTGKSYTGIRLGEIFDKDYLNGTTAIDKIAWRPSDFGKAMELIENDEHRAGQIVVVDEAGILVNAKKWYSFINRGITDAVMTFRQLRGMAIFVSPSFMSIEKDVRMFVSHLGFTKKEMFGNRAMVKLYLYQLYWSEILPKYWKYRLTMYLQEQEKLAKFNYFFVRHPQNQELVDEYEKKAKIYKREIRAGVMELDKVEKGFEPYVIEIIEQGEILADTPKGKRVYADDVQNHYNLTFTMSRMIARRVNEQLQKSREGVQGGV